MPHSQRPAASAVFLRPLKGVRIASLALNLPGPAALMRCQQMGASCVKLEPPAPAGHGGGDPMQAYNAKAFAQLHAGIRRRTADLKTAAGQAILHRVLLKTDVLLTSFRPSALNKLGLGWRSLQQRYPELSLVSIVGAPGSRAEEPGHDLTYLAEHQLLATEDLPRTLYADMAGSLLASEAVLQVRMVQLQKQKAVRLEVPLSAAAAYLALPLHWGLTAPQTALGGAHAGYKIYPCKDGRVALAALEPHFASALAAAIGLDGFEAATMFAPQTHAAVAAYMGDKTRKELDALAAARDIPLVTMA
jgi:alpha-methylacyl-CoA racemase